MSTYIREFSTLGKNDTSVAGGKGANLGELTRAGLPVPPGFVVTAEAFRTSMSQVRDERGCDVPTWPGPGTALRPRSTDDTRNRRNFLGGNDVRC